MSEQAWTDRQGDVWRLGDDGLMHTPETAPFPREYVERKWGPLRPAPTPQARAGESEGGAKGALREAAEVELTDSEIDSLVYEAGPDADHDRIVFAVERIIAERVRMARVEAWDEGFAARAEYGARRDVPINWPDLNPYRERADTYAD